MASNRILHHQQASPASTISILFAANLVKIYIEFQKPEPNSLSLGL